MSTKKKVKKCTKPFRREQLNSANSSSSGIFRLSGAVIISLPSALIPFSNMPLSKNEVKGKTKLYHTSPLTSSILDKKVTDTLRERAISTDTSLCILSASRTKCS